MNTYEKLMEITAEVLQRPIEEIRPDLSMDGQGVDSLDVVDILMEIEDRMGIYVPDSAITEMRTLADLAAWLEEHQ